MEWAYDPFNLFGSVTFNDLLDLFLIDYFP